MAELRIAVRIDALKLPIKRALEQASALGVRSIEMDARGDIHPEAMTGTGLRHLKKMLSDLNLNVVALRFQTRRGYDIVHELDRRVDATKSAMLLAYQLGCRHVINQIGRVPDSDDDPGFAPFQSVINDLGRYGTRVGAFLAAETGTESGERLASLIDGCEDGFIGVALNPGYLVINRHDVSEAIASLGRHIQLVCATDGVLDLAAGRGLAVPIGEGTADFPQVIGMLEDFQFRGPFIVGRRESTLAELKQGIEYLSNL
ncbi:sugar phosphate isomerase/epimerase family protein [Stieleria varia]|uniref:Xylose isomerase-like TIM barrel n=1 Tax=Stieleria varia TaxID=2528005 RepID=A0A5C6AWF5_9BACT|nr:sugar phosphate isomerase/epimerase family protein [Stieleria varia]TWU04355.1 Xylose isomerase-like TIM barrel [Stieleria varia]